MPEEIVARLLRVPGYGVYAWELEESDRHAVAEHSADRRHDKLIAIRLPAMADAFQRQLGNPEFAELSFEDRLGFLVDAE